MSADTKATIWRFVQAIGASFAIAAFLLSAKLHAAVPYNTEAYCRACLENFWAWVCALQGCW